MIFFLFACVGSPEITPSQVGCSIEDPANPEDSALKAEVGGTVADVWRTMITRPNIGDTFNPEITAAGQDIEVHEAWDEGTDATETCFEAHLDVRGFNAPIEVRWYSDAGSVPFDTVTITPE